MSHPNADVITRFYQAFQQLDAERMVGCYAPGVSFSDPAFGTLTGDDAADMWRMLTTRAKNFSLTFSDVQADANGGSANWVATYLFSQTGRTVVNRIQASFVIRDGLIVEHRDQFDMWRWSAQALGFQGLLIGWTPLLKNTVRRQARNALRQFQAARASAGQQGVEAHR
ncbi:Ketosteroid isomerase-related protein [Pseudomonas flavescens]|uniref:Ketosteroid isomerase-related protein n=1 Tax=Phytopseudomonas flavescens TaxID=29435 RepID=A0A1G8GR24_9GAMM|nr:nuclear transport factor 2 family protein [Pseudomonas flavescens]SDH96855.1 Ketosteroid isomerase-related protein [Pseudomonas flavescens]